MNLRSNSVMITILSKLYFCFRFFLVNVAVRKSAYQSSDWDSSCLASLSNDGNPSGDWSQNTCSATSSDGKSWWMVNLGQSYNVHHVVFNEPQRWLGWVRRIILSSAKGIFTNSFHGKSNVAPPRSNVVLPVLVGQQPPACTVMTGGCGRYYTHQ